MKRTILFFATLLLSLQVFSQWDGTSSPWTAGTGTQADPYQISSPKHLAYLADMVTAGVNDYSGKHFLLTQDISLSNQSWMPIGDNLHPFKGNFDGGGHTIDSIYVYNGTYGFTGLFGAISNNEVCNVNVSIRITSGTYRGGLSACAFNARATNCKVSLNSCSTSSNNFGGIIGISYDHSAVSNCSVTGNISGNNYVGGIVGEIASGNAYISNCQYSGVLSSVLCGGIIGGHSNSSVVIDSIVNCTNNGRVYGSSHAGGIVGSAYNIYVSRCANTDSVVSRSSSMRTVCIGGIVGFSNSGTIEFSYNRGCIKAEGTFAHSSTHANYYNVTASEYRVTASGIGSSFVSFSTQHRHMGNSYNYFCNYAGIMPAGSLTVMYCYNTGNISVPKYNSTLNSGTSNNNASPTDGCNVYGVGYNSANCYNTGTIDLIGTYSLYGNEWGAADTYHCSNCYYRNGSGASTGGASRTEAQMKSSSFPIILNTDSTVFVMDQTNENNGYPVFWFTVAYDVTSDSVTDVDSYSATLHGHYGGEADTVGFCYGLNSSNPMAHVVVDAVSSPVSYALAGLQPNTQYRYAFFVKHNGTYVYGDTLTFTTKPLYSVSITSNNASWGTVSGGGQYGYGEVDTVYATPSNHYRFLQWSDGNDENPRPITIVSDTSLTAQFATQVYTITVSANNDAWGYITGTGTYEYGSAAIITAIPYTGYHFKYWTNAMESWHYSINPWTINSVTSNNTSSIAVFEPNQYTVTVLSNNDTLGYVSGEGTYQYGANAILIAIPLGNNIFTQWSDGDTNAYRIISVTQNVTYTAIFTDAIFNITAQSNNATYGTVAGSGSYARGSQVQISAIPNEGYHFTQWNDGNTDNPRIITINADATYTAQFAINTYVMNVSSSNTLMGSATGGGIFSYGQQTTIEATAMPHYRFTQWSDGVNSNPRVVTITADTAFTAMFEQMPQYTIAVVSADESKGSVSGGGTFYGGEQTIISATATAGNVFDRWSDGNTEAIRTITVSADATYTAYFSGVKCTVNVYSSDDYMGSVSGGGEYEQGAQATVTATPASGYRFVRWNNGVEANPYTFTVYNNVNIIANFESNVGLDDVEETRYTVVTSGTSVVVKGAENRMVSISDIVGRTVYTSLQYDGGRIDLLLPGVYLMTIDKDRPIKIVLIN